MDNIQDEKILVNIGRVVGAISTDLHMMTNDLDKTNKLLKRILKELKKLNK